MHTQVYFLMHPRTTKIIFFSVIFLNNNFKQWQCHTQGPCAGTCCSIPTGESTLHCESCQSTVWLLARMVAIVCARAARAGVLARHSSIEETARPHPMHMCGKGKKRCVASSARHHRKDGRSSLLGHVSMSKEQRAESILSFNGEATTAVFLKLGVSPSRVKEADVGESTRH